MDRESLGGCRQKGDDMTDYQKLSDEELLSLLFTEADRLPRAPVDEFVRRGEGMFEALAEIASTQYKWTKEPPEWWAVVHAVFILGAMGGAHVVIPLAHALRWAVAYDCDWVTEQLPSIFGRIGAEAIGTLQFISIDATSDWYTRTIAMEGLAAITINHPEVEKDVFSCIGAIFKNENEDWDVRQSAGNILLDFVRGEYKDDLIAFGKEEKMAADEEPLYGAAFTDSDVHETFSKRDKDLWSYTRDWLSFYDEHEIQKRQERWKKEDREKREREDAEARVIASGTEPYVRQTHIGRNDPCPCGSGKKYKKCCLGKEMLH